jgi:glycosyltransferase involved in cell wall biosynthesis
MGTRTLHGELIKHLMFRAIDGAKVHGAHGAQYAGRYGLREERTTSVTQSINLEHFTQARLLERGERDRLRRERGLKGCVFVFIGRLVKAKGVDELLSAYARVAAEENVSLLIIGDGAGEEGYRTAASRLPNVVFSGFLQAPELPNYLALGDVMVFPTHGDGNGLVVEEALAAGLPVISSSAAGNIRARIEESASGYVVRSSDPAELADRMGFLARNPDSWEQLRRSGLAAVSDRAHEQYAADFGVFIRRVMRSPKRRGTSDLIARTLGRVIAGISEASAPATLVSR